MSKQKILSTKELRAKKVNELLKLLNEKQVQLNKDQLAMQNQSNKNTNLFKPSRQLIARIKTVLAEKRELAKLEINTKK